MPDVPLPEDLPSEQELLAAASADMTEAMRMMLTRERPIEMKRVESIDFARPKKREPVQHVWLRARDKLDDDMAMHQCMLAYASDMGILSTCTLPHGMSWMTGLMSASLDHAMWFHRPFRVDEWILFAQDSPAAAGARGFNRGSMFTRDGTLIASVAQEGLIRVVNPSR